MNDNVDVNLGCMESYGRIKKMRSLGMSGKAIRDLLEFEKGFGPFGGNSNQSTGFLVISKDCYIGSYNSDSSDGETGSIYIYEKGSFHKRSWYYLRRCSAHSPDLTLKTKELLSYEIKKELNDKICILEITILMMDNSIEKFIYDSNGMKVNGIPRTIEFVKYLQNS